MQILHKRPKLNYFGVRKRHPKHFQRQEFIRTERVTSQYLKNPRKALFRQKRQRILAKRLRKAPPAQSNQHIPNLLRRVQQH